MRSTRVVFREYRTRISVSLLKISFSEILISVRICRLCVDVCPCTVLNYTSMCRVVHVSFEIRRTCNIVCLLLFGHRTMFATSNKLFLVLLSLRLIVFGIRFFFLVAHMWDILWKRDVVDLPLISLGWASMCRSSFVIGHRYGEGMKYVKAAARRPRRRRRSRKIVSYIVLVPKC